MTTSCLLCENLQTSVITEKTITTRSYRHFDEELFLEWLEDADWSEFYELTDPSEAWDFIQSHIECYLDGRCPITTKVVRDMGNKWMHNDIRSLIFEHEQNGELFLETKK